MTTLGPKEKRNAYMRDYRDANRDRLNAAARQRRLEKPERYAASEQRKREKRNGNPEFLARMRDRRYGLAEGLFEAMLEEQNGQCAICSTEFGQSVTPHVDHDHACCPGQKSCGDCVRGLLCARCNAGIGSLGDDVDRLRSAISYLTR